MFFTNEGEKNFLTMTMGAYVMGKAKTSGGSTTKPITPKQVPVDLASIREDFDGLKKEVRSLPEGKQKTNILNYIENVYFGVAKTLKEVITPPVSQA